MTNLADYSFLPETFVSVQSQKVECSFKFSLRDCLSVSLTRKLQMIRSLVFLSLDA